MSSFFRRPGHQNSRWSNHLLLKLANIAGALLVMGANGYSVISPLDIYYTGKETYFTPAPWAFFLWPLIHLLLLGTCIYQFSGRGKELIIDMIGWNLPLLDVLNVMYIYSWGNQEYKYALVFIIFTGSVASKIYQLVKMSTVRNICDELFLHLPFSLYHGWATCLILSTAFEAFGVNALAEPARVWTKTFVFLSLFTLQTVASAYAYATAEGDLPGCIAISWFLWAVFVHQTPEKSPFVHWCALGAAIMSLCWLMRSAIGLELKIRNRNNARFFGSNDHEGSRLLGGH
ncbi:hypothetical protein K503DRAFT_346473 [Rhizopogon vinicolor AM-OR11-026]|uniref:Uncharacterized protein n=1 Tax=Rhizopogon vinicolor AM-OR11-026 TaxID=1314800 RepID=A0A1B7NCF5_9AGAM|nr:hypothetical protein K503DRAFT_346473 [Rhizopogon vinicolor AM-OR11-026]